MWYPLFRNLIKDHFSENIITARCAVCYKKHIYNTALSLKDHVAPNNPNEYLSAMCFDGVARTHQPIIF